MARIAVLITCHNRRLKTLACLESLLQQVQDNSVDIYLTEDGSKDGTREAVAARYPQIRILSGDGSLFWNRGMALAFRTAYQEDYDFYLWLNDDTKLIPTALTILLTTYTHLVQPKAIVVGATCDPLTHKTSYSGVVRRGFWQPLNFERVEPSTVPQPCDTMNGNCVFIPRAVVHTVGILDTSFTHSIGDFDYGLRAAQLGCSLWVAPGHLGYCAQNPTQGSWTDTTLPRQIRWQKLNHPKGLPWQEWKIFTQRHGGFLWPLYWVSPSLKVLAKR
jgi:GT2 family glycosyltransferase